MPLFLSAFSSSSLLQYLWVSHRCFGGIMSSAMWRSVAGLMVPNPLNVIRSFETSGITNPATSHLIEKMNLSSLFVFFYCWSSSCNVSLLAWILVHPLFLILGCPLFFSPSLRHIYPHLLQHPSGANDQLMYSLRYGPQQDSDGLWLFCDNTRWFKYDRTDLYVNKPHCAAAVRPWEWSHNLHPPSCSG